MPAIRKVWLGNSSKLFWRGTDAAGAGTGTFVEIEGCKNIQLPQIESEEIETSDLSSPDGVKEYQLGDTDPGTSTIEMNWDPTYTVHIGLYDAALTKTLHEFRVNVSTTGKTVTWKARVKAFPPTMARNEPISVSMELRNTSTPVQA